MDVKIADSWKVVLKDEFSKPYFEKLVEFVKDEKSKFTIYPPGSSIFSAFEQTALQEVKVVILGQDPYHGENQAHGLCFSVLKGIEVPPSLRNIYKEINSDLGFEIPNHGDLTAWAKQGVLLLNATLTVRANQAGSHQGKGWEIFTDKVIESVSENCENVVFLLWGNYARSKKTLIDTNRHKILEAPHPSPLSCHRGFFNCKHFSKANEYLKLHNKSTIDWSNL